MSDNEPRTMSGEAQSNALPIVEPIEVPGMGERMLLGERIPRLWSELSDARATKLNMAERSTLETVFVELGRLQREVDARTARDRYVAECGDCHMRIVIEVEREPEDMPFTFAFAAETRYPCHCPVCSTALHLVKL